MAAKLARCAMGMASSVGEEVPTQEDLEVPTEGDASEMMSPPNSRKRARRTKEECHGNAASRTRKSTRSPAALVGRAFLTVAAAAIGCLQDAGGGRGTRNLTTDEKWAFVSDCRVAISKGEKTGKVAEKHGVGKNMYARLEAQWHTTSSLESQRVGNCGAKQILVGADLDKLRKINQDCNGDKTFIELAAELKEKHQIVVSPETVRCATIRDHWRSVPKYTCPFLTEANMEARRVWAHQQTKDEWDPRDAHVDIDEKWFKTFSRKRKRKVDPLTEKAGVGRTPIHSKMHVPKVMFLCAIGVPNMARGFNGKIGMWRCSAPYTAKRTSKYHKKGEVYEKDVNVDAEYFEDMMLNKVMPALRAAMPWARVITVQMDNATPHVGKGIVDTMQQAGMEYETGPLIRIIAQPPNSPDCNLLDLAFFNSLACQVSKRSTPNVDELVKVVHEVYNTFHTPEKLMKLWALKKAVLQRIAANDGGNQFKMPHNVLGDAAKGARQVLAPVNGPRTER
mmetsp:Transcript_4867/g.12349  ORF Transcript_4867/g.12349 Transcript_4867/m.12349 type:complete len:507 (+) Transcript_4867:142-1662(+)